MNNELYALKHIPPVAEIQSVVGCTCFPKRSPSDRDGSSYGAVDKTLNADVSRNNKYQSSAIFGAQRFPSNALKIYNNQEPFASMDEELLRGKGLLPEGGEIAAVDGFGRRPRLGFQQSS